MFLCLEVHGSMLLYSEVYGSMVLSREGLSWFHAMQCVAKCVVSCFWVAAWNGSYSLCVGKYILCCLSSVSWIPCALPFFPSIVHMQLLNYYKLNSMKLWVIRQLRHVQWVHCPTLGSLEIEFPNEQSLRLSSWPVKVQPLLDQSVIAVVIHLSILTTGKIEGIDPEAWMVESFRDAKSHRCTVQSFGDSSITPVGTTFCWSLPVIH